MMKIEDFNSNHNWNLIMRKPAFCISENKGADQVRSNHEADQHLCFRYKDSTIPHILWLYRQICVGPCRKPRRQVFS